MKCLALLPFENPYMHAPGVLMGGLLCGLPMCHAGAHQRDERTWTSEEASAIASAVMGFWEAENRE